jgi:hypothetical protein
MICVGSIALCVGSKLGCVGSVSRKIINITNVLYKLNQLNQLNQHCLRYIYKITDRGM